MINSDNLCMSCMKEIGDDKECPHCGFHADSPQIAPYLPIRTVLANRYLVGKLLEYNGDGATYMGLDLSTRSAVNIREYFPEGIALPSALVKETFTLLFSFKNAETWEGVAFSP